MTREESKNYIGELKMYAKSQGWDEEYQIACDMAMNELEQEPILDKIRAEIMSLDYIDEDKYEGTSIDPQISRDDVLDIIDKYKAESEE